MHERVRRRREERGLPGYVLAQRLGISPSYVSLIESGKKVPGEDIARRMAEALDDDADLYAAWAHSSGVNDLDGYTNRLMRLRAYASDPTLQRQLRSGEDLAEPDTPPSAKAAALASIVPRLFRSKARAVQEAQVGLEPDLVVIPLLDEGADPAAPASERKDAGQPLRLDPRLFADDDRGRLFAYRATPDMARRAGGSIRLGDWLILTSRVDPADTQGIFAVRSNGRIVLSPILVKGREVLLLPPPGTSDYEIVAFKNDADLSRVLAGRVVMKLRGM
jgi:transcriptional regulator with XRE-family HTH domain